MFIHMASHVGSCQAHKLDSMYSQERLLHLFLCKKWKRRSNFLPVFQMIINSKTFKATRIRRSSLNCCERNWTLIWTAWRGSRLVMILSQMIKRYLWLCKWSFTWILVTRSIKVSRRYPTFFLQNLTSRYILCQSRPTPIQKLIII